MDYRAWWVLGIARIGFLEGVNWKDKDVCRMLEIAIKEGL